MKKKIAFLIMCLGIFSFMFGTALVSCYANNRPTIPIISSGQVFPLNVHGTVVYLTNTEDALINWMLEGGWVIGLVAAAFGQYFEKK
jgi:hypothetical protein